MTNQPTTAAWGDAEVSEADLAQRVIGLYLVALAAASVALVGFGIMRMDESLVSAGLALDILAGFLLFSFLILATLTFRVFSYDEIGDYTSIPLPLLVSFVFTLYVVITALAS